MPSSGTHSASIWLPRFSDATSISASLPTTNFEIRLVRRKRRTGAPQQAGLTPRLRDAGKRFRLDRVTHLEFAVREPRHAFVFLRPCALVDAARPGTAGCRRIVRRSAASFLLVSVRLHAGL